MEASIKSLGELVRCSLGLVRLKRLVPDSYLKNLEVNKRPTGTFSDDSMKRKGCRRKSRFPLTVGQRQWFPMPWNGEHSRQTGGNTLMDPLCPTE